MISGGAGILQYRHKGSWNSEQFAILHELARICAGSGILVIVNDRADYCAILRREGIDAGLHIGQDDLSPEDARTVIGPDACLGFSTHNASQMIAVQSVPVDYLAFGPVFGTRTKENPDPMTGVALLREARALTSHPLVAIGGITTENAMQCWRAGADSVAVISGLLPVPFSIPAIVERMREWKRLETL